MSTPVHQDELRPDDPKYYAPPRWRTGEKAVQPSDFAVSTSHSRSFADDSGKSLGHSDQHYYAPDGFKNSRVRITALACAVGVIAWTAFCVTVGLSRLETPAFAQLRNVAVPAEEPNGPLNERLQAANDALNSVS